MVNKLLSELSSELGTPEFVLSLILWHVIPHAFRDRHRVYPVLFTPGRRTLALHLSFS